MTARQSYIASPSVAALSDCTFLAVYLIAPSLLYEGNKITICQNMPQEDRCGRMPQLHSYVCRALLHAMIRKPHMECKPFLVL